MTKNKNSKSDQCFIFFRSQKKVVFFDGWFIGESFHLLSIPRAAITGVLSKNK